MLRKIIVFVLDVLIKIVSRKKGGEFEQVKIGDSAHAVLKKEETKNVIESEKLYH